MLVQSAVSDLWSEVNYQTWANTVYGEVFWSTGQALFRYWVIEVLRFTTILAPEVSIPDLYCTFRLVLYVFFRSLSDASPTFVQYLLKASLQRYHVLNHYYYVLIPLLKIPTRSAGLSPARSKLAARPGYRRCLCWAGAVQFSPKPARADNINLKVYQ
jgi:hypothetical protein